MPELLKQMLMSRGYMAPEGEGSGGGGGKDTPDRGDDVTSPLENAGKANEKDGKDEKDEDDLEKKGVKDEKDEDDETPEEKAEREKLEAEEEKKKRIRIPKSRFDEALGKARAREEALIEEIERLKKSTTESATQKNVKEMQTKINDLQDKYEDLILDGKKDEARKVRKEVEELREELTEFRTNVKSDAARRAAVEELTYNATLASLESKYPGLNPEHDDFDEEATKEVAEVMSALAKGGMKRNDALSKAVRYVMGNPPSIKSEDIEDKAKELAAKRAEEARRKAAEAAGKQPSNTNGVGKDSDKGGSKGGDVDVLKLDQKKFAKLDEDTKAKLRGDVV